VIPTPPGSGSSGDIGETIRLMATGSSRLVSVTISVGFVLGLLATVETWRSLVELQNSPL